MPVRDVKTFVADGGSPLLRDVAEVPRELVEDFARHLFRLSPSSRIFDSQLEFALQEINTGQADFLGWWLEHRTDSLPSCDKTREDLIARASEKTRLKLAVDSNSNAADSDEPQVAEVPKDVFEVFARHVLGFPPDKILGPSSIRAVVNGIADGTLDFLGWARERQISVF